jgi:hypothetical protein
MMEAEFNAALKGILREHVRTNYPQEADCFDSVWDGVTTIDRDISQSPRSMLRRVLSWLSPRLSYEGLDVGRLQSALAVLAVLEALRPVSSSAQVPTLRQLTDGVEAAALRLGQSARRARETAMRARQALETALRLLRPGAEPGADAAGTKTVQERATDEGDMRVAYLSCERGYRTEKRLDTGDKLERLTGQRRATDLIHVWYDEVYVRRDGAALVKADVSAGHEYGLLVLLLKNRGRCLDAAQIYRTLWLPNAMRPAVDATTAQELVKVPMAMLRSRLDKAVGGRPRFSEKHLPRKKASGYLCEGPFEFSVILTLPRDSELKVG